MSVQASLRACVRACVRASEHVSVRESVRAFERASVRACKRASERASASVQVSVRESERVCHFLYNLDRTIDRVIVQKLACERQPRPSERANSSILPVWSLRVRPSQRVKPPVAVPPQHCAPRLSWPPPNVSCKSMTAGGLGPLHPSCWGRRGRRRRRYGPGHCWRRARLSLCSPSSAPGERCLWRRSVARHNARRGRWPAKEAVNT